MSCPVAGGWVVTFRLAGREYAISVWDVVEVLRMVAVTPLPEASRWVDGVLDYRGRVIPVMDGRARLGLARRARDLSMSIVVVHSGGRVVGIVVDEAVGVVALPQGAVQPAGEVVGGLTAVSAVVRQGERLALLLDSAWLCAATDEVMAVAGSAGAGLAGLGVRAL